MPCGLNIWSDEAAGRPAPRVDIIAVQGLGSHEFYTWVKKVASRGDKLRGFWDKARFRKGKKTLDQGQEDGMEVMWIRDLLVPEFQDARIATYSYKSDWRDLTVKTSLRECANLFLNELLQHRQKENALVIAASSRHFRDIGLSVAGIIFLGGPFQGSDAALWGSWLAQALHSDRSLLELLQKDSQPLFDVGRDFADCHTEWDTVKQQSATQLGKRMIPLDTDHSGLNKFSGEDDINFKRVLPEIQRIVKGGVSVVTERFRANVSAPGKPSPITQSERLKSIYLYPNRLVARYVDRSVNGSAIIDQVNNYFSLGNAENRSHSVVLLGMGGAGKTQIALRYCEEARRQDQIKAIFWVDASSPSSLASSYEEILNRITGTTTAPSNSTITTSNQYDATVSVQQTVQLAKRAIVDLQILWMLVFDNFDRPEDFKFHGTFSSIKDYWPSDGKGSILITSRNRGCERLGKTFDVGIMSVQEASLLLLNTAQRTLETSALDEATKIVQLLGCLALAVDQAGAYICSQHLDLSQYAIHYAERKEEVLKRIPRGSVWEYSRQADDGTGKIPLSVFTTWELSWGCISGDLEERKAKSHFLSMAAFLNPFNIYESLFGVPPGPSKWGSGFRSLFYSGNKRDSYKFGDVITEFEKLSLVDSVRRLPGQICFTIHPLVSDWIRLRLSNDQRDQYLKEALFLLRDNLPKNYWQGNDGKGFEDILALNAHLETAIALCSDFLELNSCLGVGELHEVGLYFAEFLSVWDKRETAKGICTNALQWREDHQLRWDLPFLELASRLIFLLREEHDLEKLKSFTVEMHSESRKQLRDDNKLTLIFLMHVGWMYQETGRLSEAEQTLLEVWNRNRLLFGPQHLRTLVSQGNLAVLYNKMHARSKSTLQARATFDALLETQGPNYSTTLMLQELLCELRGSSDDLKDLNEALALTLDCSTRLERIYGPYHPSTFRSYLRLCHIYSGLKRYEDAHDILQVASAAVDTTGDHNTYELAEYHWTAGRLHRLEGQEAATHSAFQQAFDCLRRINRLYDNLAAQVLALLCPSYKKQGQYNQANELISEVFLSYQNAGEQNYHFEEKLYWTRYWLFAELAFFEDSSKLSQVRLDLERAIYATKQLLHSTSELAKYLGWAQTGYTHLKEPGLIDQYSLDLLECWNSKGTSDGVTHHDNIDNDLAKLATQTPAPSFLKSICDALLEWHYYPDMRMLALAAMTLCSGDLNNAQIALELCLTRDSSLKETPHPWINCDLCSSPVKFGGTYLQCTSCQDCILHESCSTKYEQLESPIMVTSTESSGCINHEFLQIPREEWNQWDYETVDGLGQTLGQWLVVMRDRYGGCNIPVEIEEYAFLELLT
ncbi:MAG: hypothetical protein M1825_004896 [Sarcosagium campestre]|nr:MAG: hypothetical protein M1825_004896 [Sarcosagium campestre]